MTTNALPAPDLRYTLPPPDLLMPQQGQELILLIFGGGAVLLALYVIALSLRRRSWLPLLFLAGGGFSVMLEPIADVLGNVIHAPGGQIMAFQAEGHPVPWHVVVGYIWYYGTLNVMLFDRFRAGTMTPALWWKTALWSSLAVTAVEQIPIYYGIWVYYGAHPFRVGLMPLAMAAANAASVMVSSMLVYRLMPVLTGWRQWLVPLMVPCFVVGSHTGASVPSYIMLGQDTAAMPFWLLQAGTLLTTLYSFGLIWLGIALLHGRLPAVGTVAADASRDPVGAVPAAGRRS